MTEKEIKNLHDKLFNYLYGVHQQNPTFMFRVRRMNNQNRLDKGYWFNGNNSYLETSFWDYKDNLHQTPVIRLVYFFESKEWACELVARNSREREAYFGKMGKELNIPRISEFAQIWRIKLDGSFLEAISKFIKPNQLASKIDSYIDKHSNETVIRLLDAYVFKKDIAKINLYKENKLTTHAINTVTLKLPYAISEINIKKFEGIKSINEFLFSKDEVCQWVFLTGENSAASHLF